MKRYAVVIEKADGNYSAYVPDLPGFASLAMPRRKSCPCRRGNARYCIAEFDRATRGILAEQVLVLASSSPGMA